MASGGFNRFRRARLILLLGVPAIALFYLASRERGRAVHANSSQRSPVLVELFTSEGCSDCPPADALLAQLDANQFVPGADAIVLSEHVTYWNHQGWRDRFSFEAVDERQQRYGQQFGLDSVYTPQMIVDGAVQLVGSNSIELQRAVTHAAEAPKIAITIAGTGRIADGSVEFSVRADGHNANLVAALAENATRSEVTRGENAGRTLRHVAVVSTIKEFGASASDGRLLRLSSPSESIYQKEDGPLRLVVFLVDRKNGHVLGAAEQTLPQ